MALAVGSGLGGYEILARLKAGGMATLYLARRSGAAGFRRHVAIKLVHDHLAEDRDFVRMFVDEALLQARIQHPNVVHVEELGEANGQHFLVMEYVHGCSLSQLLTALAKRDRALSPDLAASVAMQVLAGLHAAHELRDESGQSMGVVHRDVSPQNVLLAYEGHVKLIDFGVAKARNRAQQTAAGGLIKGKLRYMAPEQASGLEVDRRTDVYALGIVLWEMLTMTKLFSAPDELLLLDLVRNPVVERPSAIRAGVPPALEAVVMKALAFRPEDRFASAHEFRRALAEAAPGALLADASQLAELLGLVMTHEMDKEQKQLPQSVSAVLAQAQRRAAPAVSGDEALRTMTISAAGIAYLSDASPSRPSTSGMRPSSSSSPSGSQPARREDLSTAQLEAAAPQPGGARTGLLVGLGALAALAVIVGAVYVATSMRSAPAEMSVTPLSPSAAPAPVLGGGAPPVAPPPTLAAPGASPASLAPGVVVPSVPGEVTGAPPAPSVVPPPLPGVAPASGTASLAAPGTDAEGAGPAGAAPAVRAPGAAATDGVPARPPRRPRRPRGDAETGGVPLATEF